MPLFPASSVTPFARFPARLSILSTRTPIVIHEALTPLFILFLTLLLFPKKTFIRNAITLPVILTLYIRLSLIYSSSHWGFAFCVGAYTYFGSLQAFNLLVVKDVGGGPGEDSTGKDVRWSEDDTAVASPYANGATNGAVTGHGNGSAVESNGNGNSLKDTYLSSILNGMSNGTKESSGPQHRRSLGYPELYTYPLWQRIRFTTSLIASSRGVGWKFQIRQISPPPPADTSVLWFIAVQFGHILLTYVILDSYSFLMAHDPFFHNKDCWTSPFHPTPLTVSAWNQRCLPPALELQSPVAIGCYTFLRKSATLTAIFAILLQLFSIAILLFLPLTKPSAWAPLFGAFSAFTSLRGFWTVFWHGIFKKGFSYPGEYLAYQILRLDRRTLAAQIIITSSAFLNSAGLHGLGCYTLCGRGLAAAGFFFFQPLGFLVEGCILMSLDKLKIDRNGFVGKLITTTWLLVFMFWSSDIFTHDFLHAGITQTEPVAWSTWRWYVARYVKGGSGWVGDAWRWGDPKEWFRWDGDLAGGWGLRL